MPRENSVTYRRRRLAAFALLAALGLLAFLALGSGDDGGAPELTELTPEQVHQGQLEAEPVELELSVSGDLLIHSPVFARALALGGGSDYDFEPLFAELDPYVEDADLAICHVEVPMSDATPSGYPLFNTPPSLAEAIAASGWDACSTASNHSLDQGQEGVVATGRALDRAGVEHTGSSASEREQQRILMLEAEGAKVAFLAYATDLNGLQPPEPYSVDLTTDPREIIADAKRARRQGADAVIVNVHWGSELVPEYVHEVGEAERRFATQVLAADEVTAVVGQGAHVVQPIDRVGGKYVVYGEGNLVSNQGAAVGLAEASQDGLIAELDLVIDGDGDRVTGVRYVPIWVSQPDYTVLPVGDALEAGAADEATLRASYERTVAAVGRGEGVEPVPARLP